jgi:hypothetical protein
VTIFASMRYAAWVSSRDWCIAGTGSEGLNIGDATLVSLGVLSKAPIPIVRRSGWSFLFQCMHTDA